MRKKNFSFLALVLILALVISGCGAKDTTEAEEKQTTEVQKSEQQTTESKAVENKADETKADSAAATDDDYAEALKARAEKEGVSVEELSETLENLVKLTAYRYDKTPDQIKADYEADGKTVLEVYATAADVMGLSIAEYFDAEEDSVMNMSDEEKDMQQGLVAAGEEAKNIIDGIEVIKGNGKEAIEVDLEEIALFKDTMVIAKEIEDANNGEITYQTSASLEEIRNYYQPILENSKDFSLEYNKDMRMLTIAATVNDDVTLLITVTGNTVLFIYGNE